MGNRSRKNPGEGANETVVWGGVLVSLPFLEFLGMYCICCVVIMEELGELSGKSGKV